jgi:hypothetical protein
MVFLIECSVTDVRPHAPRHRRPPLVSPSSPIWVIAFPLLDGPTTGLRLVDYRYQPHVGALLKLACRTETQSRILFLSRVAATSMAEPAMTEPTVGEPTVGATAMGEPVMTEPTVGVPTAGATAMGEPVVVEPMKS